MNTLNMYFFIATTSFPDFDKSVRGGITAQFLHCFCHLPDVGNPGVFYFIT